MIVSVVVVVEEGERESRVVVSTEYNEMVLKMASQNVSFISYINNYFYEQPCSLLYDIL